MNYYLVDLHICSKKFLNIFFVWLICLSAMTSASISNGTLRNDTQVVLKFRDSIFLFVYISSTRTALLTSYLHRCSAAAQEHQRKSRFTKVDYHYPQYWSLSHFHFSNAVVRLKNLFSFLFIHHVLQHFDRFDGFCCVLSGTNLQWAQSTTTQLPEHP